MSALPEKIPSKVTHWCLTLIALSLYDDFPDQHLIPLQVHVISIAKCHTVD